MFMLLCIDHNSRIGLACALVELRAMVCTVYQIGAGEGGGGCRHECDMLRRRSGAKKSNKVCR